MTKKMDYLSNLLKLEILQEEYLGNTIQEYLVATAIFLVSLLFFKLLKNRVFKQLEKWSKKTKTDVDDEIIGAMESVPKVLYFFAALYFGLQSIVVNATFEKTIEIILIVLLFYWATKVASRLIGYGVYKLEEKQEGPVRRKNTTYLALSLVAKIILWSTGILLILSNLGVNITAFIASLGIGGIAVALALQNILGDIFSSFTIYLDKPFEIGDYIIIDSHEGTVKKIGLKTTRIEALRGEEIVVSNNELTSSRIQNFKRMAKRRGAFTFGVTYNTKATKLAKIPKLMKQIIEKEKNCTFDRSHFRDFGDHSLNFETTYYIETRDYKTYLNVQQKINLGIVKVFEKEEIQFAFPTQTVYLKNE